MKSRKKEKVRIDKKRKRRLTPLRVLAALLALAALALILLQILLPVWVKYRLNRTLLEKFALRADWDLKTVSFHSLVLEDFTLSAPGTADTGPALCIGRLECAFRPLELLKKRHIRSVSVTGIQARASARGKKANICGIALPCAQRAKGKASQDDGGSGSPGLPVSIGNVSVNDSEFDLLIEMAPEKRFSARIPFELKGRGIGGDCEFRISLHPFGEEIVIEGRADPSMKNLSASLKAAEFHTGRASKEILSLFGLAMEDAVLDINAQYSGIEKHFFSWNLESGSVSLKKGAAGLHAEKIGANGRMTMAPGTAPSISGKIQISGADAKFAFKNGKSLKAAGINADIPFAFGNEDETAADHPQSQIEVRDLSLEGIPLGGINGTCEFRGMRIDFEFIHTAFVENLDAAVSGHLSRTFTGFEYDVSARFGTGDQKFSLDLSKFAGNKIDFQLAGKINGRISTKGKLGTTPSAEFACTFSDGSLSNTEGNIKIEGIKAVVNSKNILARRSDPGQQLSFESWRIGTLLLQNGKVFWQLEEPESLLVERFDSEWCEGSVSAHALRIKPGMKTLDLIVYAGRLRLDRVLEELNLAKTSGDGTINGRIPLSFSGSGISVNDGFLYSTPGNGGIIGFKDSTGIAGALKGNSIQMGIAYEALKKFRYEWVKLKLNSQFDSLKIELQMDGKPARKMPFVYSAETGLQHVDGEGNTNFQGIRFDINFLLPLNKLLKYKKGYDTLTGSLE